MKVTSVIMLIYLIVLGLSACVYALTGTDPLWFLCFYNSFCYRAVLSFGGVAAAWLVFWAIFFKPFRALS